MQMNNKPFTLNHQRSEIFLPNLQRHQTSKLYGSKRMNQPVMLLWTCIALLTLATIAESFSADPNIMTWHNQYVEYDK